MEDLDSLEGVKELRIYRRLLFIAGAVYLLWWFAVELLLPGVFNPFISRLCVVACIFATLALSYFNAFVQRNVRCFFILSTWLITLHYYYLLFENGADANWIVGAYITVIAINLGLLSSVALLSYSIFVLLLSILVVALLPALTHSIFLPGLITILIQANMGMRSRFGLIKTLADSNSRFQLLFNSTFEGILVHDNEKILNVNEALITMTGFSRKELLGISVLDLIHPDEKKAVAEKMKSADVPPYETKGLKKSGLIADIEVRAKSFTYDGRVVRLVTIQEIMDRKRAERERVVALTMAENVRVRDEFISIASHELKTPISSLMLQTQMIARDLKKDPTKLYTPSMITEIIALFNRQVDRLTELVDTMLDVSRISAGRLVLELKDVDLTALVREVVEPLEVEAPSGALMVKADPHRLMQVVENLLTNAKKYGNGKPVKIKVAKEKGMAVLTFADQGLGISPELVGRIFDRFERAVSSQHISGLGLGLYIAREIMEAHGGEISVESELNVGSTFRVTLPLLN